MRRNILSLFLATAMIIMPFTSFAETEGNIDYEISDEVTWTAEDFTYGDYSADLESLQGEHLTVSGKAITVFSESGEA